jgi:hypothetical protein
MEPASQSTSGTKGTAGTSEFVTAEKYADLERRVADLEAQVAALREQLNARQATEPSHHGSKTPGDFDNTPVVKEEPNREVEAAGEGLGRPAASLPGRSYGNPGDRAPELPSRSSGSAAGRPAPAPVTFGAGSNSRFNFVLQEQGMEVEATNRSLGDLAPSPPSRSSRSAAGPVGRPALAPMTFGVGSRPRGAPQFPSFNPLSQAALSRFPLSQNSVGRGLGASSNSRPREAPQFTSFDPLSEAALSRVPLSQYSVGRGLGAGRPAPAPVNFNAGSNSRPRGTSPFRSNPLSDAALGEAPVPQYDAGEGFGAAYLRAARHSLVTNAAGVDPAVALMDADTDHTNASNGTTPLVGPEDTPANFDEHLPLGYPKEGFDSKKG